MSQKSARVIRKWSLRQGVTTAEATKMWQAASSEEKFGMRRALAQEETYGATKLGICFDLSGVELELFQAVLQKVEGLTTHELAKRMVMGECSRIWMRAQQEKVLAEQRRVDAEAVAAATTTEEGVTDVVAGETSTESTGDLADAIPTIPSNEGEAERSST